MSLRVEKFLCFVILLALFVLPATVLADTLFVSPTAGTFRTGQNVTTQVMVTSTTQPINAVSGILTFPPDKLQVTSISKAGSILTLWVLEPAFSNSAGTVTFEGVVPNPGFGGSNGRIITVNFRAVSPGAANVRLTSGQILANDGNGTDILRVLGSALYNITAAPAYPTPAPAVYATPAVKPPTPVVTPYVTPAPPPVVVVVPPPVEVPEESTISFGAPSFEDILFQFIRFLSILIPLALILIFLKRKKKVNSGEVEKLRSVLKEDISVLGRMVSESFSILKDDAKRADTKNLKKNIPDAEKLIQKEVSHTKKDIGN